MVLRGCGILTRYLSQGSSTLTEDRINSWGTIQQGPPSSWDSSAWTYLPLHISPVLWCSRRPSPEAKQMPVPCSWTYQPPELYIRQTSTRHKLFSLRYSAINTNSKPDWDGWLRIKGQLHEDSWIFQGTELRTNSDQCDYPKSFALGDWEEDSPLSRRYCGLNLGENISSQQDLRIWMELENGAYKIFMVHWYSAMSVGDLRRQLYKHISIGNESPSSKGAGAK